MADFTTGVDPKSLAQLLNRLNHIGNKLEPKERTPIGDLLNITALDIARIAKKPPRCPVVTGRLRASIHPKLSTSDTFMYADNHGGGFDGGLKAEVIPGKQVVVGTNVEYAPKIEANNQFLFGAKIEAMPKMKQRLDQLAKKVVGGKPNISVE